MRKFILLLLSVAWLISYGQGGTLFRVNIVKPKAGLREAFETSWKQHLDKYHKTTRKMLVYEITSGPTIGSYVFVEGPFSYADLDTEHPDNRAHILDLDKSIDPKTEPERMNHLLRYVDTLSFNPTPNGEKVVITTTILKDGKLPEYLTEIRRTVLVNEKIGGRTSYQVDILQQAGSTPTLITIRNLREGFKELEPNYFQMAPNTFRDTYISQFGTEAWDKRMKILVDNVISRELHFEKIRKDLSSPR